MENTQNAAGQTLEQTPPPSPPGYQKTDAVEQVTMEEKKDNPTLYSSSYVSIIFKNFLAGFARALGSLVVYVVFLIIMSQVFIQYVYPQLEPYLEVFQQLGDLQALTQTGGGGAVTIDPETVNQIMEQLNQ